MISKINVNIFKPSFGVVTEEAQKRVLELAGNNKNKITEVKKLIADSEKNAPDVYISHRYNHVVKEEFYTEVHFDDITGENILRFNTDDTVTGLDIFRHLCKSANKIQKNFNNFNKNINKIG